MQAEMENSEKIPAPDRPDVYKGLFKDLDYEKIDSYLLDHEETTTEEFKQLLTLGHVTREVVKSRRGMNNPLVRRIIQDSHFDLVNKGYKYRGFATAFRSTSYETIGITHIKGNEVTYILFDHKNFRLPIVLSRYLGDTELLFGAEENLAPFNTGVHPLLQENKRLLDDDYRTGKTRRPSTISRPLNLTENDKEIYNKWFAELQRT